MDNKNLDLIIQDMLDEDIEIPDELDFKVDLKLKELDTFNDTKNKSKILNFFKLNSFNSLAVSSVASILVLLICFNFSNLSHGLISFFNLDKGINNAAQHGFKPIDKIIYEKDGFTFKILNFFFDGIRAHIDVEIESEQFSKMNLNNTILETKLHLHGEKLGHSTSFNKNIDKVSDNKFVFPIEFNISSTLSQNLIKSQTSSFQFLFNIKEFSDDFKDPNPVFKKSFNDVSWVYRDDFYFSKNKIITLNKSIKAGEYDVILDKLIISPMAMNLTLSIPNLNKSYLTNFKFDSWLEDANNNKYIGESSFDPFDNKISIIFNESIYFDDVKALNFNINNFTVSKSNIETFELDFKDNQTFTSNGSVIKFHTVEKILKDYAFIKFTTSSKNAIPAFTAYNDLIKYYPQNIKSIANVEFKCLLRDNFLYDDKIKFDFITFKNTLLEDFKIDYKIDLKN